MNPIAPQPLPNGPGAAAILAAGIGCATLGVFDLAGDASPAIGQAFVFWQPTGTLSGVTVCAIVVWLLAWLVLSRRWAQRNVNLTGVTLVAFSLLAVGLALTFPPFMDLLQGK
jgi:hypothetical protein